LEQKLLGSLGLEQIAVAICSIYTFAKNCATARFLLIVGQNRFRGFSYSHVRDFLRHCSEIAH
jgi:hypothetical protein